MILLKAEKFLCDFYRSNLCQFFPPNLLAAASIYMSGEFQQVDLCSAMIKDNVAIEQSIRDLGTPSSHVKLASRGTDMLEDFAKNLSKKDSEVFPVANSTKSHINTKFSIIDPNPTQSGMGNTVFDKKESLSISQTLIKDKVNFGGNPGDESFNELVGFKRDKPDPITIEISLNTELGQIVDDQILDHTINNNLKKLKVDTVFLSESIRSKDDNIKDKLETTPIQNLFITLNDLGSPSKKNFKPMDLEPSIINKDELTINTNKQQEYNIYENNSICQNFNKDPDVVKKDEILDQKDEILNGKCNSINRDDDSSDGDVSFRQNDPNNLDLTNTNKVNTEFVLGSNYKKEDSSKNIHTKKSEEDGSNSKVSETGFLWYQIFGNDVTLEQLKTINKLQFQYQKLSKE